VVKFLLIPRCFCQGSPEGSRLRAACLASAIGGGPLFKIERKQ
jgi:hypothetical protein